jgi:hypothetical protein
MASADLLLVIDSSDESSVSLPSKPVDHLEAGVPILVIVPPGVSASLIGCLCGRVANPASRKRWPAPWGAIDDCWSRRASRAASSWGPEEVRAEYRAAQNFFRIIAEIVV